jgi:hypothetical protein
MRDEDFTDDESGMIKILQDGRDNKNDMKNNTLFTNALSRELASTSQVLKINLLTSHDNTPKNYQSK